MTIHNSLLLGDKTTHQAAWARLNRARAGSYQATSLLRAHPAGPHIAGEVPAETEAAKKRANPARPTQDDIDAKKADAVFKNAITPFVIRRPLA